MQENIVSVNEIYKKLGALVYEQSHQVDSIEASVEQTSVFVSEGVQQLKQASHYQASSFVVKDTQKGLTSLSCFLCLSLSLFHHLQNKARKKKLILALIAAAILAFIILIIVLKH